MRTRLIRYGKLVSFKDEYGHVRIEKEVELEPGDDEDQALAQLRASVESELGLEADFDSMRHRLERLEGVLRRTEERTRELRDERTALYEQIHQAEAFVRAAEKAGIEVPKPLDELTDPVPF